MDWERPRNETKKSYIWLCPKCGERVYFVPRGPKKDEKPKCLYRYCAWCGEDMTNASPALTTKEEVGL